MQEKSIQSVITSPPYGDLRDYGVEGQIGLNQDYEQYLTSLDLVWQNCYKVLKNEGTLWVNIGHKIVDRELRYIGADIANRLKDIGFKLLRVFYWYKRNYASGYNKKDLLFNFEPIYCFVKNLKQYYLNISEAEFGDFSSQSLPHCSWMLIRKGGSLKISNNHSKKKRDQNNPHPAPFPDELAERIIKISTRERDRVLDPFLGSGTTTKVAASLNRMGIGFEINPDFYQLNKCRMELDDDFSQIQRWIKKFNKNRDLMFETQKVDNF